MRRIVIVAVIILAAAGLGHFLFWRWAEGQLEQGFATWATEQRSQGWTVHTGETVRTGWPMRAALDLPSVEVSSPAVRWTAQAATIAVSLLHPGTLAIMPQGRQTLQFPPAPPVSFTADHLVATVPLDPGPPVAGSTVQRADVDGTGIRIDVPGGASGKPLVIALMNVHAATAGPAASPTVSFAGSGQDIALPALPAGNGWPLGDRIASISAEGAVRAPGAASSDPKMRAAAWRDGGGALAVDRFAIGWGPLGLSGKATLTLDADLQPVGNGEAHVIGQNATLDALAAGHALTPAAAGAAKAVLGLLARPAKAGEAPGVDVPLTLENRTLRMGAIPLMKLPRLEIGS